MAKSKIDSEKQIVEYMILLYCKGHKHDKNVPCDRCQELIGYAKKRLQSCKFGDDKPSCNKCTVHCYNPQMKNEIKMVMSYSGPRMLFHHPLIAMRHLLNQ